MNENLISVGDLQQVISSGTIIQFNNQPIELKLGLVDFPLSVILKFVNTNTEEMNLVPDIIDGQTLSLEFHNYNNPLGTGSSKPLKIADYQGKHIYLNYRVYSLNDTADKTIHYSFYLSEELI